MTTALRTDDLLLRQEDDGTIRIGDTRVLLEIIVAAYNLGNTPEEIAESFSAISLADIYSVIGYYLRHQDKVDIYIGKRTLEAHDVRTKLEAMQPPQEGMREKLQERLRQKKLGN